MNQCDENSEGLTLGNLTPKQEGLGVRAVTADQKRTEVPVPVTFRPRFGQETKLVEVSDTDRTVQRARPSGGSLRTMATIRCF